MAEQSPLSTAELQESFEAARDTRRKEFESGSGGILRDLSNTVAKLQQIGIDIGLQVIPGDSAAAYDMMYHVSSAEGSGGTITAHGYVRIGETSHLFAIGTQLNGNEISRLYLSQFNISEGAERGTPNLGKTTTYSAIQGTMYDFRSDPEALQKLQKRLTDIAALNAAVLENDPSNVFNAPSAPYTKPAAKFKP